MFVVRCVLLVVYWSLSVVGCVLLVVRGLSLFADVSGLLPVSFYIVCGV